MLFCVCVCVCVGAIVIPLFMPVVLFSVNTFDVWSLYGSNLDDHKTYKMIDIMKATSFDKIVKQLNEKEWSTNNSPQNDKYTIIVYLNYSTTAFDCHLSAEKNCDSIQ